MNSVWAAMCDIGQNEVIAALFTTQELAEEYSRRDGHMYVAPVLVHDNVPADGSWVDLTVPPDETIAEG